jgi:hypothetical protein
MIILIQIAQYYIIKYLKVISLTIYIVKKIGSSE